MINLTPADKQQLFEHIHDTVLVLVGSLLIGYVLFKTFPNSFKITSELVSFILGNIFIIVTLSSSSVVKKYFDYDKNNND